MCDSLGTLYIWYEMNNTLEVPICRQSHHFNEFQYSRSGSISKNYICKVLCPTQFPQFTCSAAVFAYLSRVFLEDFMFCCSFSINQSQDAIPHPCIYATSLTIVYAFWLYIYIQIKCIVYLTHFARFNIFDILLACLGGLSESSSTIPMTFNSLLRLPRLLCYVYNLSDNFRFCCKSLIKTVNS